MVKSSTEKANRPSLKQVVCIDVETNDLIDSDHNTMPYILQFSAVHDYNEYFNHLVIPKDENFTISEEATKVNGWTKKKFLEAITPTDQTISQVWSEFLHWLVEIGLDFDQDIYLCAYNGFRFDFRVIINELRRFDIYKIQNFKLIDPWLDTLVLEKTTSSLDKAYLNIQHNSWISDTHDAKGDCYKLKKLLTIRSTYK